MDYTKHSRLLQKLVVTNIVSSRRYSHTRLIDNLKDLDFITRKITDSPSDITIELQVIDPDPWCLFLSGEASRFWMASMVSLERSHQDQKNNAAWETVEHYYSAFYAVHYLLRICGISLTNIDDRAVLAIQRSRLLGSSNITIPKGLYTIRFNPNTQTLTMTKRKTRGPGGSHQEVWTLWDGLLLALQGEANSDPIEYAGISLDINQHRAFIKSAGNYNPPDIRAEINYQFRGGVWGFEKNANKSIKKIKSLIKSHETKLTSPLKSPECLITNNRFIIELSQKIFKFNAGNFPKSICGSILNKLNSRDIF